MSAVTMSGRSGVEGGSLVQRAIDAVRSHIRTEELRVGDSLPGEGHFADKLGVSRAVMREAFGVLAALRLIDVGNGRKPRVSAIDGAVIASSLDHAVSTAQISVADVWDVRRTIEIRTAALAAQNRTDAEARTIVELAEAMDRDHEDMARVAAHDIAFHDAIARAGKNALFVQIVASFAPLMQEAVPAAWKTREGPEDRAATLERHRTLARAIMDRDADAAVQAMDAHFDASIGDILRGLANPEPTDV
jgi:GntR family transcriptional repressor for pyruvate dehydrogenase complex